MRKIKIIFLLIATAMVWYSCEKDEDVKINEYSLKVIVGNQQDGTVTLPLNDPIICQVINQDGDFTQNKEVSIEITSGTGSIESDTLITNELGQVEIEWILGAEEGTQSIQLSTFINDKQLELSTLDITAQANTYGYFVDERDNHKYKFVLIGELFWMAENLDYGTMINGSKESDPDNNVVEKYYYDNSGSKGAIYGGLYQWDEMMQGAEPVNEGVSTVQGIAPKGWHIPSKEEWFELEKTIKTNVPSRLKSTTGWNVGTYDNGNPYDYNGTDEFGFAGLPGGYRYLDGTTYETWFMTEGIYSYYWTASANTWNTYYGITVGVYGSPPDILDTGNMPKAIGTSVRCVMDKVGN